MGKEQTGRRGRKGFVGLAARVKERALCSEASCLPLLSYILAATFFTPFQEPLPGCLCARETCLSCWCICSRLYLGCCCWLVCHGTRRARGTRPGCARHGARAWASLPIMEGSRLSEPLDRRATRAGDGAGGSSGMLGRMGQVRTRPPDSRSRVCTCTPVMILAGS